MGISTTHADELLQHAFGISVYTPETLYVGLFSAAPTDAGGGTELTGDGYARKAHAAWEINSSRKVENNGEILFAAASGGDWDAVTHVGVFDAISGGTLLYWTALDTARTALDGDQLRFVDNELDFTYLASADG